MSAGAVNITFGAIVTGFTAGLAQMGASVRGVVTAANQAAVSLNGNLSASFAAGDRQARAFRTGISRAADGLQDFGRQASLISAGIGLVGIASFKAYSEIDSLKRGLTAVMGSATAADEEFKKLRVVAALPGLGLAEAAQGSIRLQAVGFSAQQARDALLQFGNAVALTGGGKAQLEQITVQLGQLAGKGKVLSQDLRPIIEAAPAIAPILNKAFGSVDPEIISGKLAAAGKNSKDFVQILTQSLSGLDRVTGGPKIALENFGDSLQIAGNNFGQAADKALGLTDKINGLGNLVGSLADKFATLSPFTQQVILGLGGAIAVVGPLALALGGLLTIIPAITAGAATLTTALGIGLGPIAAIGLAVAGAAVLVITNWDRIKAALTDSGIWSTLTGLVSSGIETVKSVFGAGVGILTAVWNRFGGFVIGAAKVAFDGVAGVFNFAGGVLSGALKIVTGVLTLNWSTFSSGFIQIGRSLWNVVIDIFKFGIGAVGRTVAATIQLFGGDSLADKVTAGIDKALGKLDNLKSKVSEVAKESAKPVVPVGTAQGVATPTVTPFSFTGLGGDSELKKAKDRLKQLKTEIFAGQKNGVDVSAQVAEYKALKAQIDATNGSLKTQKEEYRELAGVVEVNERIIAQLTKTIQNSGDPTGALSQQLALLKDNNAERQREIDLIGKSVDLGKLQAITPKFDKVGIAQALTGTTPTPTLPGLAAFQMRIKEEQDKTQTAVDGFKNMLGVSKGELALAGVGILEGLGTSIGAGQNPLKSFFSTIVGFIGDFAIKIGSAILLMGKLETLASAIPFLAPLFALTGPAKIAVGASFLIGGAAIKAIPFANGGIVSGATFGLMGEYAGARNNPEVIAPLNTLVDLLPRGGTQTIIPDVRLEHDAIYFSFNKGKEAHDAQA